MVTVWEPDEIPYRSLPLEGQSVQAGETTSVEVPLPYSKPLERAALTGAKQLMEAIEELTPRRRR